MGMNLFAHGTRVLAVCGLLAAGIVRAQDPPKEAPKEDYVKSHYTKYEYRIPMRDGKKLFTSVYVPKDTSQSYPILIDRTPTALLPTAKINTKNRLVHRMNLKRP